jgi:type IV secretion system protein VirB5
MSNRKNRLFLFLLPLLFLARAPAAHAQWAVIDVASLGQLIQQYQALMQQYQVLTQQLSTAQSELTQVRNTFNAMTGGRGMQQLLSGTARNYLPTSLSDMQAVLQGSSATFGALSASMSSLAQANAVLTPAQVANLSPALQVQLAAARNSAALLQAIAGSALTNSSNRFASLQQLISAIGSATDQKGILDLNARIAAEQGMLQDEHTKLDVLYQLAQAQQWAVNQRAREQAIVDIGSFRQLPPMGLR